VPSSSLCFSTASFFNVAEEAKDGLLVVEKTVEEEHNMQYECAVDGLPPYYYYRYSNVSGPKFLTRTDHHLMIKIDRDYHDDFICCQSHFSESLLAAMLCHHMNVACKCISWLCHKTCTISAY